MMTRQTKVSPKNQQDEQKSRDVSSNSSDHPSPSTDDSKDAADASSSSNRGEPDSQSLHNRRRMDGKDCNGEKQRNKAFCGEEKEFIEEKQSTSLEQRKKSTKNQGNRSGTALLRKQKSKNKNELTKLIPGYTAPMKLQSSSLDHYRPTGGLTELQRRAERSDASTRDFVVEATSKRAAAMIQKTSYTSFKKGAKRKPDETAGRGWFGMVPTPMTDELKTDLAVIRNRAYLDPKRFYKSADKSKDTNMVQLGTVIEGAAEFYSSRLTKKQRRANITEEILADTSISGYAKNKYKKMQQAKMEEATGRQKRYGPKRGKRGHY